MVRPSDATEVAETLAASHQNGRALRFVAGGSKQGWGSPVEADAHLDLSALNGIVEHNEGDLTAILRAGTPLTEAQEVFARAGQMLAIDAPGSDATIGGVVATADSGPLRHRYATTRDLVLGLQVATPEGTLARAGSKVIKNVAGYDLAKLFTGSFGTLGVITEVIVRLHPIPRRRATIAGLGDHAAAVAKAAAAVGRAPLELECLDITWHNDEGRVFVRAAGTATDRRLERAGELMREQGLGVEEVEDDEGLWKHQAETQRSREGLSIRVSGLPAETERVIEAARAGAMSATGRASYGLYWLTTEERDPADLVHVVEETRARLDPFACVVLDAPEEVRRKVDVWQSDAIGGLGLMGRIKQRFDPRSICNPGIFAGEI